MDNQSISVGAATGANFVAVSVRQAWICPRCSKVNAPHVDHCVCVGATSYQSYRGLTPWTPDWGTVTYQDGITGVAINQSLASC